MQELIEKLNDVQRQIIAESEYANGYDGALSDCISAAESLLEKEKLQIIEAYEYGNLQVDYTSAGEDALNYYEETYKNE